MRKSQSGPSAPHANAYANPKKKMSGRTSSFCRIRGAILLTVIVLAPVCRTKTGRQAFVDFGQVEKDDEEADAVNDDRRNGDDEAEALLRAGQTAGDFGKKSGDQTDIRARDGGGVPRQPASFRAACEDGNHADDNDDQAVDGKPVEGAESAGKPIDKQCTDIERDHAGQVDMTECAMPACAFADCDNRCASNQGNDTENGVYPSDGTEV